MMENSYSESIPLWIRRTIDAFLQSIPKMEKDEKITWRSVIIQMFPEDGGLILEAQYLMSDKEQKIVIEDQEITDPRYQKDDWERRSREMVRSMVVDILNLHLPWGILTGVRPSKLYHKLRLKGFSPIEIEKSLIRIHRLSETKAALLREVCEAQAPFIKCDSGEIGVYIGIPFCPTRCRYCSFASHPLSTHGHLVAGFVEALVTEIKYMANFCHKVGYRVGTIYIGGGTPTSLSASDLERILKEIAFFPGGNNLEFTVEAGRPETITQDRLQVFKRWGINRISVNPQTMHEQTLRRIGRVHSVEDVFRAVELVKKNSIPILNMDLIAGLPGEDVQEMELSLKKVMEFEPQNITLHTLAPKRAAEWGSEAFSEVLDETDLTDWLGQTREILAERGWLPYYLYRQRRIMANQENIGYAKQGTESLYNIWMMEEYRTILGLGGGAITKWVDPINGFVDRRSNPKCPATFSQRVAEEMTEKVNWLKGYLN